MQIRLVILDFDGVIVESNDIKDKAFRQLFGRYPGQYEEVMEYHRANISLSRYLKFNFLLEKIGRPGDELLKKQLLAEFSEITLKLMKSVPFVKGAQTFLKDTYRKLPVYLVSVTPISDLEIILDHLQIRVYFKDVYGCPPWNKPDAIRDILQKENIAPANVLLVGDSYGDQRAALQNNIHFIGRNSGLGFEDPRPAYIIPDLTGLASFIQN